MKKAEAISFRMYRSMIFKSLPALLSLDPRWVMINQTVRPVNPHDAILWISSTLANRLQAELRQ
jgi:hypothetical protein